MMRLPGRKLALLFRRNENKDERIGEVEYTGYDLFWRSGVPVSGLAFDRFCKVGVRYILGRDKPATALIDAYFVPLADREAALPRVPGHRLRALYLRRAGTQLQVFLSDETPTDISFDMERDEKPVLAWLGADHIPDGADQWFAFYASRADALFLAPEGRERRRASPSYLHSPSAEGGADGRMMIP